MAIIFPEGTDRYIASGGADGDKNESQSTTTAGKQNTATADTNNIIESRQTNPLSTFSSYTYQLTLYMISPSAYNAFVETGRTNINAAGRPQIISQNVNSNDGIFIVAQSGGVNKTENRAPYLDLDYYIDDLKYVSAISAAASRSQTNTLDISFKIIEPYGFSFITQLKFASDTLKKTKSSVPGMKNVNNAIQQFFILGVRFIGYDEFGNVINASKALNNNFEALANPNELYEQFFDIQIHKLDFKLDGRATVYNITAKATTTNVGFGIKYGRIDNNEEIQAENVGVALTKLAERLTAISKSYKIDNNYKIVFQGEGASDIEKATFYNEADLAKINSAMSISKNVNEVNETLSLINSPKLTVRKFALKNDTSILQAIDDIITQSSYLTDALSVIYNANLQSNQATNSQSQKNQNNNKEVKWYHISAEVKVGKFDDKRLDYSYDITYVIQPYKTPVIRAAYVPKTTKYYGPHKRYSYYFTGKNSEIIEYTQTFNNAFFTIQNKIDPNPQGQENATQGQGPVAPGKIQNESRLGTINEGREAQNAFRTSLYDPGSTIAAKITIMGDPDFLVQPSISNLSRVYNQFYGPGYSINANGGQVFIEIDFNEAKDYDENSKTGLLKVNDKIYFWDYPQDIQDKVKGIIYQVYTVTSTFSRGKFTQVLDCFMPTFMSRTSSKTNAGLLEDEDQTSAEAARLARSATTATSQVISPPVNPTNPAPAKTTTATANQRTVPAKVLDTGPGGDNVRANRSVATSTPNRVADDDSGGIPPSLPPFLGA
jgi:hypothetical protein